MWKVSSSGSGSFDRNHTTCWEAACGSCSYWSGGTIRMSQSSQSFAKAFVDGRLSDRSGTIDSGPGTSRIVFECSGPWSSRTWKLACMMNSVRPSCTARTERTRKDRPLRTSSTR
jgi:hypothetical protein